MSSPLPEHVIGAEWAALRGSAELARDALDARRQRGPCPICGHPTGDCTPAYVAAALAVSNFEQGAHP